jgi:hypothetical protein
MSIVEGTLFHETKTKARRRLAAAGDEPSEGAWLTR